MLLPELSMTALILIQARSGSKRLPGKVYEKIGKKTVLEHVLDACDVDIPGMMLKAMVLGHYQDSQLKEFCQQNKIESFFPDVQEDNLTERYLQAVSLFRNDAFLRITADCPMMRKDLIRKALINLTYFDYVTNTCPRTFVDGLDVQGMRKEAFMWYALNFPGEEHLFFELENNYKTRREFEESFQIFNILNEDSMITNPYFGGAKSSIDTLEDLERVRSWYERMAKEI